MVLSMGRMGAGVERSRYLPDLVGKFISYAKSAGLYAGLDFTGSIISERTNLEKTYYGKDVTLTEIVLMNAVSNKGADNLLETLKKTGGR